jgi:PhnB protein
MNDSATSRKTRAVPEGYHTITPTLVVEGGARALDFYRTVFGAEVLSRFDGPKGEVLHAELRIGDSRVVVSDPFPDMGLAAPRGGGHSSSLMLYCDDVDAVYARALVAGAKPLNPPKDEFHGDRIASLLDPFGHRWLIATHIEDVSPEELKRRVDAWSAQQPAK